MRLPRGQGGAELGAAGQPKPPALWPLTYDRLSRRQWGESGGQEAGAGVDTVEGPRLLSRSPCPQVLLWGLEPGFLPRKPAGHCFTHSDDNSPSWLPPLAGGCLLGAESLGEQRQPPRSAEVWRRGSKEGKQAASPSPSLSLQCWAVTCQGL